MGLEDSEKILSSEQIIDGAKFTWTIYPETEHSLAIIELTDSRTGISASSTLPNRNKRSSAYIGWQMARHSRAPGSPIEIANDMGSKGVDPDQKIDETFRTYGHASVADMAPLNVNFHGTPMSVPYALFNTMSTNGGQEKSTRYQKQFGKSILHPVASWLPKDVSTKAQAEITKQYEALGHLSQELFQEQKEALGRAYRTYYAPENDKQEKSLDSRVLDTARSHLLFGQLTGFGIITSAREWSRTISHLKAAPTPLYHLLAQQIETLLAPDREIEKELQFVAQAPSLIRHTTADHTIPQNLSEVDRWLRNNLPMAFYRVERDEVKQSVAHLTNTPEELMLAQYILTTNPQASSKQLLECIGWMKPHKREELSTIIYNGHTEKKPFANQANVGGSTILLETSLGEVRDWNRHRSLGRFSPQFPGLHENRVSIERAHALLESGYVLPEYLHIPAFAEHANNMREGLAKQRAGAKALLEYASEQIGDEVDYGWIRNVLPLAQHTTFFLHGEPSKLFYTLWQRERNGGHINYRLQAWDAAKLLADSNPLLSASMIPKARPDPADREAFFDRS